MTTLGLINPRSVFIFRITPMNFDFDILPDRRSSESIKWHTYEPDVIPLWVADMDFVSPPPVIEAFRQRVEHGVFGYPREMPELRALIVERLQERYDWRVQPEEVLFIQGVIPGFNQACHAFAGPQQAILVQPPVYPHILQAAQVTGRLSQEAQLSQGPVGSYDVDLQAFEATITGQTRLFILCNPHNPVGRVFRRSELESMAELCMRHGVKICSDEIHCDLVFSGQRHLPLAALDPEISRNTITLMSPSKTFNLAGLKFAFAIIQDASMRQEYQEAGLGLATWTNLMAQVGAWAAYLDGQPWLDRLLSYLEANLDFLYQYVSQELPGLSMARPEGTYLAWVDCRAAGIPGNPAQFFLDNARVALGDGETFGPGGEGFVRLNFGCPRSTLVEAVHRMKAALETRPAESRI